MKTHVTWAKTDSEAFVWTVYHTGRRWQTLEKIGPKMGIAYKPLSDRVSVWMDKGMDQLIELKKENGINYYRPRTTNLSPNEARQTFAGRNIKRRKNQKPR